MIKVLDKYIFKSLIGPFFFGFFLFVTIIAIDPMINALQYVINENTSFTVMIRWFFNRLPQDMIFTFPVSVLLANLLVFGQMSRGSETIAMRAGGINFYRILVPVLAFAILVTIVSFVFNETVVPGSNRRAKTIKRQEIMKLIEPESTENSILRTSDGAFAYARKVFEKRGIMERVLFEYYDSNGILTKRLSASEAQYTNDHWILKNVIEQTYNDKNNLADPVSKPNIDLYISEKPSDFARETKRPTEMSYSELKARIEAYERSQFMDTTEMRVGLAMKTSLPFASFFFAIIGASFGLTNSRSGAFVGFGVSIGIIFFYYVLMSFFSALGKSGYMNPMLSAWMQNIIFAFIGIYIVRSVNE